MWLLAMQSFEIVKYSTHWIFNAFWCHRKKKRFGIQLWTDNKSDRCKIDRILFLRQLMHLRFYYYVIKKPTQKRKKNIRYTLTNKSFVRPRKGFNYRVVLTVTHNIHIILGMNSSEWKCLLHTSKLLRMGRSFLRAFFLARGLSCLSPCIYSKHIT